MLYKGIVIKPSSILNYISYSFLIVVFYRVDSYVFHGAIIVQTGLHELGAVKL